MTSRCLEIGLAFLTTYLGFRSGADWCQKVALNFLAQSGPPNLVRNIPHHTINEWHILDIISFLVYMANSKLKNFYKGQFNITKVKYQYFSPNDTMLWYRLEDFNSAECGLVYGAFLLVIYSICPFAVA